MRGIVRLHEKPSHRLVSCSVGYTDNRVFSCSILHCQLAVTTSAVVFLDACASRERVVLGGPWVSGLCAFVLRRVRYRGRFFPDDLPFLSIVGIFRGSSVRSAWISQDQK